MSLSNEIKELLVIALANRKKAEELSAEIDAKLSEKAVAVAEIAVPATATAEDVANKVNEVIVALQDAGLMEV